MGEAASLADLLGAFDAAAAGRRMYALVEELYPICRSITGDGVRRTLEILADRLPLEVHEVPSGTPVLDWTVPPEWNVRDAWVANARGERVIDFRRHNLHLVGYSVPLHRKMPLAELREHLHSLPEQPDLIPYRTSYYEESWGFCLPHATLESLPEGEYEVSIDSTLEPGSLTYGECLLAGERSEEVLISCHVCHPSLANDNLSGIAVTSFLAATLAQVERRWSYRFLFIPGTIGSITWLARNEEAAGRVRAGLVAANLGDAGSFHYKRSWQGNALIDRAVAVALRDAGVEHAVEEFEPYGYDERQYSSPGFRLPVGLLSRTPWGRFPEYHTSADDLDLVRPASLGGSLALYLSVVRNLEEDRAYRNLQPQGEPQLGRRGLYDSLGGVTRGKDRQMALLWMLCESDGEHSLLDVAERSGLPMVALEEAAGDLVRARLLRRTGEE